MIFMIFYLFIYLELCSVCAFSGIDNIQHIVVFMQENRPFDHYFGMLHGVRGFNDRTTVPMKSGLNAFYQPLTSSSISGDDYMLPFRTDANKTNAMCMPAPGVVEYHKYFYNNEPSAIKFLLQFTQRCTIQRI